MSPHTVSHAPQSASQLAHVSTTPHTSSPQLGQSPQSCAHAEQLSSSSHAPFPQNASQSPQSSGHSMQFSSDPHSPSPHAGEPDSPPESAAVPIPESSHPKDVAEPDSPPAAHPIPNVSANPTPRCDLARATRHPLPASLSAHRKRFTKSGPRRRSGARTVKAEGAISAAGRAA